jgi:hypothetical protein
VGRPWFLTELPARPLPIRLRVEAPRAGRLADPALGYDIESGGSGDGQARGQ